MDEPKAANAEKGDSVYETSAVEKSFSNVIMLSDYVEKNIWKLMEKGHLKDLMDDLDQLPPEYLEDVFFVDLPVPANDELKPRDDLGISLEDLVEAEDSDILSKNYAWEQQELPDDFDSD